MHLGKKLRYAALLSGIALAGAACTTRDANVLLRGPLSDVDPAIAEAAGTSQQRVLAQVSTNAGLVSPPASPAQWQQFATASFDLIDQQCDTYISALRQLDISRRQTIRGLNILGTSTAGILAAASASAQALAVTALAFGLASSLVDVTTSGLLYELPPAAIRELVERLREAYERGLRTELNFANRATTFRAIRGYAELCLPAVIERHVTAAVRAAQPSTSGSANTSVSSGAPPRLFMAPPIAPADGSSTSRPTNPVRPFPPLTATQRPAGAEGAETQMTVLDVMNMQRALCVSPTGALDPPTREAIRLYRQAQPRGAARPQGSLLQGEIVTLMDPARSPPCVSAQFANVYEARLFATADDVRDLQTRLNTQVAILPANQRVAPVEVTGSLNSETRNAIRKIQAAAGRPQTGAVTPELLLLLP